MSGVMEFLEAGGGVRSNAKQLVVGSEVLNSALLVYEVMDSTNE